MRKDLRTIAVMITAFALFTALLFAPGMPMVSGAPAAVVTPITQFVRNPAPKTVNFWASATALTVDTRSSCVDVSGYSTLDLHYIIDQGTVNTTTLTLQFGNIADNYVNGLAVASANAADAADMGQYNIFGRYVCLYADVVNANAWTITAVGLAK